MKITIKFTDDERSEIADTLANVQSSMPGRKPNHTTLAIGQEVSCPALKIKHENKNSIGVDINPKFISWVCKNFIVFFSHMICLCTFIEGLVNEGDEKFFGDVKIGPITHSDSNGKKE